WTDASRQSRCRRLRAARRGAVDRGGEPQGKRAAVCAAAVHRLPGLGRDSAPHCCPAPLPRERGWGEGRISSGLDVRSLTLGPFPVGEGSKAYLPTLVVARTLACMPSTITGVP